jgi:hypothetical protein
VTTYTLYGQRSERELGGLAEVCLHRVTEVEFSLARDESTKIPVQIEDDEVVAVELEGDFILWMRGDELQA